MIQMHGVTGVMVVVDLGYPFIECGNDQVRPETTRFDRKRQDIFIVEEGYLPISRCSL